jgi:site-specific recombinase XerD
MNKKKTADNDSVFFWNSASDFINKELPAIRQNSPNTVETYRRSLNEYINYLESEESIERKDICYRCFNKEALKKYLLFMKDTLKLSEKTCNLRMTAIRSLLTYAAEESVEITALAVTSKTIKGLPVTRQEIEYFEDGQLKELLSEPSQDTKIGRRDLMIIVLGYDAALRVSELIGLTLSSIHLDTEVPYVNVLGKGHKYRNVPLMNKTAAHLKEYIKEFHGAHPVVSTPLFFATTHGIRHSLSDDTIQNILKKYAVICSKRTIMPEKVHFHMLRKTRAMNLYQAGCPLSYIQQLLGHESISTTSGFYAFATLKTLADSIEKAYPSNNKEKIWKDESVTKQLYKL